MEPDKRHKLLDHALIEFRTNSLAEIDDHLSAIDGEQFYVISMGVWRNCDSADRSRKFADAKLVLELLCERNEKVEAAGGSFVLNLKLGFWTLVVLIIVFATFALIMSKIKGLREVFIFPEHIEKID